LAYCAFRVDEVEVIGDTGELSGIYLADVIFGGGFGS
jgi:hypothetical protein